MSIQSVKGASCVLLTLVASNAYANSIEVKSDALEIYRAIVAEHNVNKDDALNTVGKKSRRNKEKPIPRFIATGYPNTEMVPGAVFTYEWRPSGLGKKCDLGNKEHVENGNCTRSPVKLCTLFPAAYVEKVSEETWPESLGETKVDKKAGAFGLSLFNFFFGAKGDKHDIESFSANIGAVGNYEINLNRPYVLSFAEWQESNDQEVVDLFKNLEKRRDDCMNLINLKADDLEAEKNELLQKYASGNGRSAKSNRERIEQYYDPDRTIFTPVEVFVVENLAVGFSRNDHMKPAGKVSKDSEESKKAVTVTTVSAPGVDSNKLVTYDIDDAKSTLVDLPIATLKKQGFSTDAPKTEEKIKNITLEENFGVEELTKINLQNNKAEEKTSDKEDASVKETKTKQDADKINCGTHIAVGGRYKVIQLFGVKSVCRISDQSLKITEPKIIGYNIATMNEILKAKKYHGPNEEGIDVSPMDPDNAFGEGTVLELDLSSQ